VDQVDDFQSAFLSKMRAFHQKDVIEPLEEGRIDAGVIDIIEKEAESIVNGLKNS
jgi:hypothetical protein